MGENGSRGQHQLSKERGFVLVNRLYWLIAKVWSLCWFCFGFSHPFCDCVESWLWDGGGEGRETVSKKLSQKQDQPHNLQGPVQNENTSPCLTGLKNFKMVIAEYLIKHGPLLSMRPCVLELVIYAQSCPAQNSVLCVCPAHSWISWIIFDTCFPGNCQDRRPWSWGLAFLSQNVRVLIALDIWGRLKGTLLYFGGNLHFRGRNGDEAKEEKLRAFSEPYLFF